MPCNTGVSTVSIVNTAPNFPVSSFQLQDWNKDFEFKQRKKKKKKWKWQNSKIRLALRILSSSILKFFRSTKNIIFITFNLKLFLKKQLYCHIYHFSIKIYNKQKLKIMSKGKQSTKKSYQNNKQKALKSTKVKEKTNNRRS